MERWIECVPNFSEGRRRDVVDAIVRDMELAGARILHVDMGHSTHRTVVTLIVCPDAVCDVAFAGISSAAKRIDMRSHHGVHIRQGATDVFPLIPLEHVTDDECIAYANRIAERVGRELDIPVYLYAKAAKRNDRIRLPDIRVGGYEALAQKLSDPAWAPDYGPTTFNARSGATVIGVRSILIAFNINLANADASIAKRIGLALREKGIVKRTTTGEPVRDDQGRVIRTPGFPGCHAMGWYIDEYQMAQITTNVLDYQRTSLHTLYDRACELATLNGARVCGSEIVGLVPKAALLETAKQAQRCAGLERDGDEVELLHRAVQYLGLNALRPFVLSEKILEYRIADVLRK